MYGKIFMTGVSQNTSTMLRQVCDSTGIVMQSDYPLHCTLVYAKEGASESATDADVDGAQSVPYITDVNVTGMAILGTSLVVLFEPSEIIKSRFNALNKVYKHSYPELLPHVTIASLKDNAQIVAADLERIAATLPMKLTLIGEHSDNIDGDTASIPLSLIAYDDEAKKREPSAREAFLRAFHGRLSASDAVVNAWASSDPQVFKASWVTFSNGLKKLWDDKNKTVKKSDKKPVETEKPAVKANG